MSKAAATRALIAAFLVGTALTPVAAVAHDRNGYEDGRYDEGRGDDDRGGGRMHDMSRELRDPVNQAKVAGTLSALTGALLSMDISPMTRAMDSVGGGRWSRDLPPDARLGDIAGENARELPYDIARKTPQAMGRMAGMLGAMDEMRPQLKAMGRQLKDTLRRQGLDN